MYDAAITRRNPACLVVLVDQSVSMSDTFGAESKRTKSEVVAEDVNRLLQRLCIVCGRADGIRELFQIGVIGYGRVVQSALGGTLASGGLATIGAVAHNTIRVESRTQKLDDGNGGVVTRNIKIPVWLDPVAVGTAPLRHAFELAGGWVAGFLAAYPDCYPPLVIHVTGSDLDASDPEPSAAAAALRELGSTNGNVLLFNFFLSDETDSPILFPAQEQNLASETAKHLFRMSSVLPPKLVNPAREEGLDVSPNSRGFALNGNPYSLVSVTQFSRGEED